jgi:hypothetical protein
MPRKKQLRNAACASVFAASAAIAADTAPALAFAAPYYARGANTNVYGVEYVWKPSCECAFFSRYGLEPRWGVNVAYWDGQQPDNQHPSLWDLGAHGYLRYFWHPDASFEPYSAHASARTSRVAS